VGGIRGVEWAFKRSLARNGIEMSSALYVALKVMTGGSWVVYVPRRRQFNGV